MDVPLHDPNAWFTHPQRRPIVRGKYQCKYWYNALNAIFMLFFQCHLNFLNQLILFYRKSGLRISFKILTKKMILTPSGNYFPEKAQTWKSISPTKIKYLENPNWKNWIICRFGKVLEVMHHGRWTFPLHDPNACFIHPQRRPIVREKYLCRY